MGNVYVFFANGFEEIEAFTVIDVLRRANLDVTAVSIEKPVGTDIRELVVGAHDIEFVCDTVFDGTDFSDAAAIVLPGGMPGAATLSAHDGLNALLKKAFADNKLVAAICAAPMVPGKLGLLKGRKSTCYPGFDQYMEGATPTYAQCTVDGNYISGIGPGGAMEFSLAIVENLLGLSAVADLKEAMCVK
jgi:4-methyl-5(b-hydroxyethyl)-thiazole monophosphate biosynthesis